MQVRSQAKDGHKKDTSLSLARSPIYNILLHVLFPGPMKLPEARLAASSAPNCRFEVFYVPANTAQTPPRPRPAKTAANQHVAASTPPARRTS